MEYGRDAWISVYANSAGFRRFVRMEKIKRFLKEFAYHVLALIPQLYSCIMPYFAKSHDDCIERSWWAFAWCNWVEDFVYHIKHQKLTKNDIFYNLCVREIGRYYMKVNYGRRFL